MRSFEYIFVGRYDFTNGKLKSVSRAAYQWFAQLGSNASVSATVVCDKRGDVSKTLVNSTKEVGKILYIMIGSMCRLVFHGKHSQADRIETIAVCGRIGVRYTDIEGISCSLPVKTRSNMVRHSGSNLILLAFC